MAYQWGEPIRAGQWYCSDHGPIEPDESGVVPACHCGRMAMLGVASRGLVVVEVPGPKTCPNGHDLTRRDTARRLGHQPCGCRPDARGHATWKCVECGEVTIFPHCSRD